LDSEAGGSETSGAGTGTTTGMDLTGLIITDRTIISITTVFIMISMPQDILQVIVTMVVIIQTSIRPEGPNLHQYLIPVQFRGGIPQQCPGPELAGHEPLEIPVLIRRTLHQGEIPVHCREITASCEIITTVVLTPIHLSVPEGRHLQVDPRV
jgi:hypothetical protein